MLYNKRTEHFDKASIAYNSKSKKDSSRNNSAYHFNRKIIKRKSKIYKS